MIDFPNSLKSQGAAHSGIAPAHLLDVLDVNGNAYYWSDRPVHAPTVLSPFQQPGVPGYPLNPPVPLGPGQYVAWMFPQQATVAGMAKKSRSGPGMAGLTAQEFQGPFTGPNILTLTDWQPAAAPPGAIVDAVYLVINQSGSDSALQSNIIPVNTPAGLFSVLLGGIPAPATAYYFEFWNTVAPTPGDPNFISIFLGYDIHFFAVYSIGVCVIYHLPPGASGPGGVGGSAGSSSPGYASYQPWILSVPKLVFNRSLATDVGSFIIQNLSGDTMQRDFERIARLSALEGAMFVYRLWDAAARTAWIEHHGTLTVEGIPRETVSLKGAALTNLAAYDTPSRQIAETCQQVIWGGRGCGATGDTECQYSFQTCQVPERFMGSLNNYEKNFGESLAEAALKVINRRRRI